ncbi:chorismate mutase [Dysgonomonas hofstadii]|uniref:chorismate mutase n=1 Tax=Dysgonomonas hofstadii TaxID=637886 RepID=A0A840CN41_9BACT|nr:chorismate mutase [Dysgonomonas hofstadii]MBB4037420.1 chorismate mutase [Dysgonomonas hofstadii]
MNEQQNIANCHSLDEIKNQIEDIDFELSNLIIKRSQYLSQIKKFKDPIKNITDINKTDILSKIKTLTNEKDVNPVIIEKIYNSIVSIFREQHLKENDALYEELKKHYY